MPTLLPQLAILSLLLQDGAGQELLKRLEREAPIRPPLAPNAVEDALEKRAHAAIDRLPHPTTKAAIVAARPELRGRLAESLGLPLMPWPPDLRATTLGTIQATGYRIEKVAYQTLPNLLVPVLVYVPGNLNAPAPAILLEPSNTAKSSPELQTFATNLAHRGFVVMIADPIGQGERQNVDEPALRNALLAGISLPGIVEYETRCALEYLQSRKGVDPARIALTGTGVNAWISAALDDRIAAAVVMDGVFDFGDLVTATRNNQASSRFDLVPGILQYANVQDLIALAAPRPVMMIAPATARRLRDLGKTAYAAFDKAANIHLFENDSAPYVTPRREAASGFLLRALMQQGDGSPAREPEPPEPLQSPADLACLPGGQLAPVTEAVLGLAAKAANQGPTLPPELLAGKEPDWENATYRINWFPIHRLNLKSEVGIETPVTILRPHRSSSPPESGGTAGTLLAMDDRDKESLAQDPVVLEALKRDYMVVAMDPRGFGELSVQHRAWLSAVSLLLGENFAWRQGWDIARMLEVFVRRAHIRAVYAHGPQSAMAATYALWLLRAQQIDWAVLRDGLSTLRQLPANPAMPEWSFSFGAFHSLDIAQLLAATKTRTFIVDGSASLETFLDVVNFR